MVWCGVVWCTCVIQVRVDDYDSSSSDDGGGDSVSSSNFLSLLKVLSLRYFIWHNHSMIYVLSTT